MANRKKCDRKIHFAWISDGSKIIASGTNVLLSNGSSIHAEEAALDDLYAKISAGKLKARKCRGLNMTVIRINAQGLCISKPCKSCDKQIKRSRIIRHVSWSTGLQDKTFDESKV